MGVKNWKAVVWIHSRGDDKCFDLDIVAPTREEAVIEISKFLHTMESDVMNDWTLEEVMAEV